MKTKNQTHEVIMLKYDSDKVRVFEVSIPEGRFIVLDYYEEESGFKSDREIYWASGVVPILSHKEEYWFAQVVVDEFLEDRYE